MFICRERGSTLENSYLKNTRKFPNIPDNTRSKGPGTTSPDPRGGTSDQGRSSSGMKRGIRDVIQTVHIVPQHHDGEASGHPGWVLWTIC